MAYQNIGTYKVYEYYKEVEGTPVRIWYDAIVEQDLIPNENRSNFKIRFNFNAEYGAGELPELNVKILRGRDSFTHISISNMIFGNYNRMSDRNITILPGQTYSEEIHVINTEEYVGSSISVNIKADNMYHDIDGKLRYMRFKNGGLGKEFKISGYVSFDVFIGEYLSEWQGENFEFVPALIDNDRAVYPTTASNFTDEENPVLNYIAPINAYSVIDTSGIQMAESIVSLQAALSLDGQTLDVGYRDIPIGGSSYIFKLTEAEREVLRKKTTGSANNPIYYLIKIVRAAGGTSATLTTKTQRVLTIIGCTPTLNPTVKDIKPETIALTGNPNVFVRYESMVEFATGAVASKHATITSQSVQNGSKIIYNLYNGVIDDIESRDFIFNATDSRGLHANQVVVSNSAMIEYVKPTCKQNLDITLSGETGAVITLTVSGNYFHGSFGKVDNTLTLEVRYCKSGEEMGEWTALTGTPSFYNSTYELTQEFSGLSYDEGYIFQCRLRDKLNYVETSQYTVKLLPVFDWSETDFNFNVPVNIGAENLDFHNRTILRHKKDDKNTILSADGNIYIRPKGTENTTGETIFYNDGRVKFGGNVVFADGTSRSLSAPDYIVEIGEDSMGSNGTWYWAKWNSGKAEAWGCRNYGNMAITTSWGNLYRSEIFSQSLPDNVFARTPEVISINPVSVGYGCWIVKHEQQAPSAATTGSFIVVRPATATITPSYIGFHIIGEWR
jgi:hypothetical protein